MLAALIALLAPQVIAPTTSGAITIDAFFDDWVDRPQWIANRPVRGDYDGPRDLSARVQLIR